MAWQGTPIDLVSRHLRLASQWDDAGLISKDQLQYNSHQHSPPQLAVAGFVGVGIPKQSNGGRIQFAIKSANI